MKTHQREDLDHILEQELEYRIIHSLAQPPLDYKEQMAFIREERKRGIRWRTAGVLLLLGKYPAPSDWKSRYYLLLNKRSANIQQPGDLCFPGGHPNRWIDLISSHLVVPHILPLRKSPAFKTQKKNDRKSFTIIKYFLGNVLREGFEEIRLNPFKVGYLGALRCYRLEPFRRVIFPLVGVMKEEVRLRPNWEVDKILRIPLMSLFNHDNYARYELKVRGEFKEIFKSEVVSYDCFIHYEDGQPDEILWGATYKIVMSFLKVVFQFSPPYNNIHPIVRGELYPDVS